MADDSISYVNIDDSRGDYFWTARQIERSRSAYADEFPGSAVSGSSPTGLLARPPNKIKQPASTTTRSYLTSGSLDVHRSGIEIVNSQQWSAGTIKISAGTPGHIVSPVCYGVDIVSIIDEDVYHEISTFDPVDFISSEAEGYTYPIVTATTNTAVNNVMNGVLEPLSIRSVASFFSIDVPREARSTKGTFGSGNEDMLGASDQVLTVDYYEPTRRNVEVFLDAGNAVSIVSGSTSVGVSVPYFETAANSYPPFEDSIKPRGISLSSTYGVDMIAALSNMSASIADVYLSEKQRSATAGFVYDNANPQGTDSIAFGGMLY